MSQYIRGNQKQIYRRKLNQKQIKFLIKFTLVLQLPDSVFFDWNRIKPMRDIKTKIYELLIRGYYSSEVEIENIMKRFSSDCKFMLYKTDEVWKYHKEFLEEACNEPAVLVRSSKTGGVTVAWKYPINIMKEITESLKKEL